MQAVLSDPSGVGSYSVTLDGEQRASGNGNWERTVTVNEQIDIGVLDRVTRLLENNELRLIAKDKHGNAQSRLAYSSSDVFVQAIEANGLQNWLTTTQVARLGVMSGTIQGAGEVLGQLTSLIKDPKGFLEELANVDKYAKLLNNLESLPGLLVQGYRQQMQASNPYYDRQTGEPTTDRKYEAFKVGYYTGVVLFEVGASAAGGAGVAAKLKKIDKIAKLAKQSKVQEALSYYRKAKRVKTGAKQTFVTGPASKIGYRIARWTTRGVGSGKELVTAAVQRTRTVGAQWHVTKQVKQISKSKREALSSKKAAATNYVSSYGDAAVEVLNDVDAQTANRLLDGTCSGSSGRFYSGVSVDYRSGSAICDQELKNKLADLTDKYDFESSTFDDYADSLWNANSETRQAAYDLADVEGQTGVELANEVFDSDVSDSAHEDLIEILRAGGETDAEFGPATDRGGIVDDLNEISDVDGLNEQLKYFSGNGDKGFKSIAGEAKTTNNILDKEGVADGDLEIGKDIDESELDSPPEGSNGWVKEGSKIDVNVETEVTIDGETYDSPAIESKHYDFTGQSEGSIEFVTKDWKNKLATQALAGEDELIVALPDESIQYLKDKNMYDDVVGVFENDVREMSGRDVDVEFVSYEDL
jgi:hypothetical protein